VVGFDGEWNDLGSWEAVKEVLSKREKDLIINGKKVTIDSSNSMVYTDPEKLTAAIGVKDLIVVDTEDALLVMKEGEGQKVKDVVQNLKDAPQATYHLTDYRPWGGYKVIDEGEGYKTKMLFVNPGQRLSLQKHEHRDEIWTIVEGKGIVTLNEEELEVKKGKTVKIPAGVIHRAENTGTEKLKILELATGYKISEDDIIRLEDDYNR
jgi:mannose-1-phosphate guanylyltransferase/mannose-6-phosphate isomerase